ncbi:MAG: PAS domain-containing protein [Phycisphaerae bacterium]|jgi:PAS domain S-box-containing protein
MSASAANNLAGPQRLEAEFLERLFEGAGLAIFACDAEGRIRSWNSLAEHLYRDRRDCQAGAALREILPEHDRQTFDLSLQTTVRSLEPSEFRTCLQSASAEPVEYAVWMTPILENDGALQGVAIWFHDITARLQYRRSMRKRDRLNALGMLSGSIAHHYNNLVCGIATSLEHALNMNTMSAMRRALQRTADAVSRAAELTQQLLAFAQADYRQLDVADLTEAVLYCCDQNEERLTRAGIELKVDCQPVPTLSVPREQFLLVLSNLVSNAVEAMPSGGTLSVSLRQIDDRISLSVSDTGAGIAPEHMERLFEPFFTTKGELACGPMRKAGMGLAVAHGLVSEMNGTISAANNPGGGARFEISFPIPR